MLRVPAAEAGRPDRTDVVVAPAQGLDRKARGGRKRSPAPASAGSKRGSRGRRPPCQSAAHGARGGETARRGRHIRFRVRTGAEAARRPAPCCNPSQRPQVCCLFIFDCLFHYFSAAATVSHSFPPFLRAVAELDRPVCIYIFYTLAGNVSIPCPGRRPSRRAFRRTATPPTRHFDRSVASGEIRPATEAGRTLRPWASTERSPDFSPSTGSGQATPPRPGAGAPVGMTARGFAEESRCGNAGTCHELS